MMNPLSFLNSFWLAWFYWDPERVLFTVPIIDRPVVWYGFFFVLGFIVCYLCLLSMFKEFLISKKNLTPTQAKDLSQILTDRLAWYVVAGTIIGARFGEVFFYNWTYYKEHPENIIKVWNGGLASHGGVIGIFIALAFFVRFARKHVPSINFVTMLDLLCVTAGFATGCIRIGNFFNQEILGTVTSVPWAVIFGHPADYSQPEPRHPIQLYEAFCYFAIFILMQILWRKKGLTLKPGILSGIFLILLLSARFFLEFLKEPSEAIVDQSWLQMSQLLSLPLILFGFYLVFFYGRHDSKDTQKKSSIKN